MSSKPDAAERPKWSSRDPWSPMEHTPGAYPLSPNPDMARNGDGRSVAAAVKARKDEYVRKKTIKVKVGTWNVASLGDTHKDLGGWFAQGLGVKGLAQDLAGLKKDADSANDSSYDTESEIESVEEQEARRRKKSDTLPKNDSAGILGGDEVDLYVLGLQEVIDVSSVTEAMKPYTDPNPARKWKAAIRKRLPRGYKKVVEQQLIGLLLLVFASPKLAPEISSVDSTSVGTGLMGYLGNKGAVSARILLGETTRLLFVNCHLAAGADETALARRIWDTQQIVSRTRFAAVGEEWVGGVGQADSIGDEDFAFWFGDLNYRLEDIPGEDVRRLLLLHARNEYDILNSSRRKIDSELGYLPPGAGEEAHDDRDEYLDAERPATASSMEPPLDPENDPASLQTTLKSLLTHDQLRAQQRLKKVFHDGWREGDINFLPTYKYDVGSVAMFDSGEKKRSPSWCDRILYRTRLDYDNYQRRAKQEAEARQKDQDMKERGMDNAALQEDVLFDYDPEADGDDYDDEVEQHDNDADIELIQTREGFEDALVLDEYVSHQRVISSDHKPLSALFTLTYDSVDQDLKAKVHQQVTREFDKAENESRPAITMVLDNHSHSASVTDESSAAANLKVVDFGDVRYRVQYSRHLTIANTGQIEVTFAFVNRPVDPGNGSEESPFPTWLKVHVHHDADKAKVGPPDLGSAARYNLVPGETANIDFMLEITEPETVRYLNSGKLALDDILVLRISNGRDYFIPVKGTWLQSCFYRSVDELVRVPAGVRSLPMVKQDVHAQQEPASSIVHSAPQELFALTDIIPKLVERVAADWTMLHDDEPPPWQNDSGPPWPFHGADDVDVDPTIKEERLAEIREALDKAESVDEHLSLCTDPAEKLELSSETLLSFLASLTDGIVTTAVWQTIEAKLLAYEKSKIDVSPDIMQEIVMEAISSTPVHSVSLTFITFMLNRLINEISADSAEQASPTTATVRRSRSSTSASAMSDVSLSSIKSVGSAQTKRSFLPSLTKRGTNLSTVSTPNSPAPVEDVVAIEKSQLALKYAEIFAPIIIRSDNAKLKTKEKRTQDGRKIRALEAFLRQQP